MNVNEAFEYINFWYNKVTGAWFTVSELEALINRAQLAYYSDIKPKYATSQLVKDILAPFKATYNFTTQISGYITIPDINVSDPTSSLDITVSYLDLLDIQVFFSISDRTVYAPCQVVNEDTRAYRLNSQVDPVTATSPIAEQISKGVFRLYPAGQHNGNVTYLREPVPVIFGYTIISGRVIVYDPLTSVQFEWRSSDISAILLKALESIGINLSSQEISNFAQLKTESNFQNINRL